MRGSGLRILSGRRSEELMITKKHDWKKGEYALAVKVIWPDGTIGEFECPHLPEGAGEEALQTIMRARGLQNMLNKKEAGAADKDKELHR